MDLHIAWVEYRSILSYVPCISWYCNLIRPICSTLARSLGPLFYDHQHHYRLHYTRDWRADSVSNLRLELVTWLLRRTPPSQHCFLRLLQLLYLLRYEAIRVDFYGLMGDRWREKEWDPLLHLLLGSIHFLVKFCHVCSHADRRQWRQQVFAIFWR